MKLAVNGKEQELRDETTLGELFEQLKLSPERIVASINGKLISPDEYAKRALGEGDKIEILSFVGGG